MGHLTGFIKIGKVDPKRLLAIFGSTKGWDRNQCRDNVEPCLLSAMKRPAIGMVCRVHCRMSLDDSGLSSTTKLDNDSS
jgi:hypothetical protein